MGVSQRYEGSRFDAVLLRIQSEVARPQLSSTLTLASAAPVKLETRNYPDISVGLNTAALLAPHAAHSASLLCFAVTVSVFFFVFFLSKIKAFHLCVFILCTLLLRGWVGRATD